MVFLIITIRLPLIIFSLLVSAEKIRKYNIIELIPVITVHHIFSLHQSMFKVSLSDNSQMRIQFLNISGFQTLTIPKFQLLIEPNFT